VERVGRVWLAFLGPATSRVVPVEDGRISVAVSPDEPRPVRLAVTNDPGWTVEIDGRPSSLGTGDGPFLEVDVPPGPHRLTMRYEPGEVRVAISITIASAVAWSALFSVSRMGGLLAKKPSKGLEPPRRSR
jgi:uncharacterized membrane protein YfhO